MSFGELPAGANCPRQPRILQLFGRVGERPAMAVDVSGECYYQNQVVRIDDTGFVLSTLL